MTDDGDDGETTVVDLQSREDVDWLRAARDGEDEDTEDDTDDPE